MSRTSSTISRSGVGRFVVGRASSFTMCDISSSTLRICWTLALPARNPRSPWSATGSPGAARATAKATSVTPSAVASIASTRLARKRFTSG